MRAHIPGRRIAAYAVLAVVAARTYAYAASSADAGNPAGTVIGRVVAIDGFHVHHAYIGALLLAAALWAFARRFEGRPATMATGFGAGLVLDEVGLVLTGFTSYWEMPSAATSAASLFLFVVGMIVLEARAAPSPALITATALGAPRPRDRES